MNMPKDMKRFEDPLYAGLNNQKAEKAPAKANERTSNGSKSNQILMVALLLIGTVSVLAYFLYKAQSSIDKLSTDLASNQGELAVVSQSLEESRAHISELNSDLDSSKKQLTQQGQELNRYKGLYKEVKAGQDDQARELQVINLRKAEQDEVDELKQRATQLQGETSELREQVTQANANIASLDTKTVENQSQINDNRAAVNEVRAATEANTTEIAAVKRSLEREYYNFELHEKGGYMKVFEVSLSLKDTDYEKRQFDLYVLADGKVIQKKDQPINEPILFYVEGQKKPYEVVVTRVDKKLVVGYLSVPKT